MKKKLVSSLLAISMMITAVQPQITFAEDIEIGSEQEETEAVEETEGTEDTADDVIEEIEDITESAKSAEIEEESEEEQIVEENAVEEQALDNEEVPIQTYSESNGYGEVDGFRYRVLDDETAEITGYTGEEGGALSIPDKVNGRDVTRIGTCAFYGKVFTGNLVIPNGVSVIGDGAFYASKFSGKLQIPSSVTEIGSSAFYNCEFTGDLIIPDNITEIKAETFYQSGFDGTLTLPSKLTKIEKDAFGGCGFTGDLEIPETVTEIAASAFNNCTFNGKLTLPEGLTKIEGETFADCKFTGDLILPDSIEEIGSGAFERNKFTGKLILPNAIKKIGSFAFASCGFTGDLILPDSIEELDEGVFIYCSFNGRLNVPSKLTKIEDYVFAGCHFTGDLVIPEGVESIGDSAFAGGRIDIASLDDENPVQFNGKLVLPDSVTVIDRHAFDYCGFTGNLTLPKNLTKIGYVAFEMCNFTGDLNIPDSVTEIDNGAFADCNFDGTLTLPSQISSIEEYTFYNCKFTGDLNIPDGVTTVGEGAFSSEGAGQFNGKLKLSANLTSIGNEAFSNCKFTGDLNIPDKVTEIGSMAFAKSDYTGDIVIPNGIQKIGENAFYKAHNKNSVGKIVLPVLSSGVHRFLFEDRYALECAQEVNAGQTIKATVIADGLSLDSPLITGWSSSNAQVASVDTNGNVSAHAKGTVTIYAELYNGRSCEKQITVNPDKLTVRFDSAGGSAVAMQTVGYKAKASAPADPVRKGYRFCGWYLNEQKYNFDTTLVQDITLTAKWEKLNVRVSSIVLSKNYIKLKRNEKVSLSCDVKPNDATNASVVWTSTNPKVATVVNGQITAKSVGQTTIIAMAVDGSGVFATCNVTVGYMIKYQLNGGKNNGGNPDTVYQETVKLNNPIRSGYLFKGWYTDKKLKHKISKITSKNSKDVTVYAKWEKVKTGKASISSLKGKKNGTAALKWKSVSGAKGYEVSFATDKKFKNNCQMILTKSKSITLKKLQPKTYYVRIHAYKVDSAGGKVYGKYSSVKSVKCK